MLRLASYDVVFQEVPGEVALALNISGCLNGCKGCHSPHLQEDIGEELVEGVLSALLERYGDAITCVCFMGGDADPGEVERMAAFVRGYGSELPRPLAGEASASGSPASGISRLKTAWYSGRAALPAAVSAQAFDYIKLGPYIERLGGLGSPDTNQRYYKVEADRMVDMTHLFLTRT